ncbi:MAG: argininosuccinate lyase [Deltaproteobacteria bacterium]|nr:argininosuccinate lyase [Deltaproteobacteria bacterium]MBT6505049.1 argininosuccinate lyase [Deltaproteobacteria bacterium]MBT7887497.1 argininosuccinate lyase [Deltaproteobacteria bacterium]
MTKQKQKSQVWGNRLSAPPDELNIRFCAGRDVITLPMADEILLEYDVWTNMAHARMLASIGVLNDQELSAIRNALSELMLDYQNGIFQLDPAKEDVHINVEHYITFTKQVLAGKKIHTGRSRNDQVSTDMRLFLRAEVIELVDSVLNLIHNILIRAEEETESIMPGFTHYQPAMMTTAGHWLTCWSQGLLRDVSSLMQDLKTLNLSPLGAAASFGTSWPINREYAADLMGFEGVEENSLDCISSRGENEARIAASVSILMNHLSIAAQDIILLSMPYYGFIQVDDRYVTGSSIMPQKRNPDFAEIIRSKASMAHGNLISLLGIQKGAMSGYNRDAQQTKYLIMDLLRESRDVPSILGGVVASLRFNTKTMRTHCESGFINSTDIADWLAQKHGLSFRDCYEVLSLAVKYSEEQGKVTIDALKKSVAEQGLKISFSKEDMAFIDSPEKTLLNKQHTGAPSGSAVEKMVNSQDASVEKFKLEVDGMRQRMQTARDRCFAD